MLAKVKVALLSTANILLAFILQIYVMKVEGVSTVTDALFSSLAIPMLIIALISGTMNGALVPELSKYSSNERDSDTYALMLLSLLLSIPVSIGIYIYSDTIVDLLYPGFDRPTKDLTSSLLELYSCLIVFMLPNSILIANLNSKGNYLRVQIVPVVLGVLSIPALYFTYEFIGYYSVVFVVITKSFFQVIMHTTALETKFQLDLTRVKIYTDRLLSMLKGGLIFKTEPMVDRYILSSSQSGTISLYNLIVRLYEAATSIFTLSMITPLLTDVSNLVVKREYDKVIRKVNRVILAISILCAFLVLINYLAGDVLLSILLSKSDINSGALDVIWIMSKVLFVSFMLRLIGAAVSNSLYSLGEVNKTINISIFMYLFFLPLKFILFSTHGWVGLCYAISVFSTINTSVLYLFFIKTVKNRMLDFR
jgi:putative peptidoglycan lipid II flippase